MIWARWLSITGLPQLTTGEAGLWTPFFLPAAPLKRHRDRRDHVLEGRELVDHAFGWRPVDLDEGDGVAVFVGPAEVEGGDVDLGVAKDGADGWSLSRYQTLTKTLDTAVTRQNAWEALRSVMAESSTLHSLVVYPESRELYLSMARWDDKLVPAPTIKPARISFDQLFANNQ